MAICRDGSVVGRGGNDPRSHAERLPLEAMALLSDHGLSLQDVDLFVVVCGPGSFTGLRVGVSAVQGWAFATGRSVAAVPTLDALANAAAPVASGEVLVTCLDGLRGEVFYSAWRDGTELLAASVGSAAEVIHCVQAVAGSAPVCVVGDGVPKYAAVWAAAGWREQPTLITLAESAVVLVNAGRFSSGVPHAARPLYVRRTDAEIVRERAGRPS